MTPLLVSNVTNDKNMRTLYDHRSYASMTVHAVMSLFRQVQYTLTVLYHRISAHYPAPSLRNVVWKQGSQGLVVLLHGLRNDPAAWFSQIDLLRKHSQIEVFAPVVPNRGMCSLEEAAQPVLPAIEQYARENPGKPICLLGVSNGSRVATWSETQLRQSAPQSPVLVSTIAGVHKGSKRMNLLEYLGLAKYFYPQVLQEELAYNSETSSTLLNRVKAPLPAGCAERYYEFYATTEDVSVPDLDSSLPFIEKQEHWYLLHGHSHDSIVTAIAGEQIKHCTDWIRSNTNRGK